MSRSHGLLYCAVLLLGGMLSTPLQAQSFLGARGLGFEYHPRDARSSGMGGVALGLPDPELSWANPAAVVGIGAPAFLVAYQFDDFTGEAAGGTLEARTARFPLLLGALPAGDRLVLVTGFGAFLDQNWAMEQPDTLEFEGGSIPAINRADSDGGVTRFRFGAAYQIVEGLGVGLGADIYTGSVTRREGRQFDPDSGLTDTAFGAAWDYSGFGVTVGAHWTPGTAGAVAASVTYGGTLEASPQDGVGVESSYDVPVVFRAGASGRVSANTLIALAGSWAGWSSLDDELSEIGGAEDSWSVNSGVEWEGLTIRDRPVPLRLGGQIGDLPFRWDPDGLTDSPREQLLTAGAGLVLAGGAVRTDFAALFGERGGSGAGVDESFWRFDFSVRIVGR